MPELQDAGRLQRVTLPNLKRNGAVELCWLGPGEELVSGPERWVPSKTGGFMYLRADQSPLYFAVDASAPIPPAATRQPQKNGDSDNATLQAKVQRLEADLAQMERRLRDRGGSSTVSWLRCFGK